MQELPVRYSDRPVLVDDDVFGWAKQWEWVLRDGYVGVQLTIRSGLQRGVDLHRLIMGEPEGMDVHHKNEDKLDCRRENLEVLTHQEHVGVHQRGRLQGEKHHNSRLTEEQVIYTMARLLFGESQSVLARELGVTRNTVSLIWRRKRWTYLWVDVA